MKIPNGFKTGCVNAFLVFLATSAFLLLLVLVFLIFKSVGATRAKHQDRVQEIRYFLSRAEGTVKVVSSLPELRPDGKVQVLVVVESPATGERTALVAADGPVPAAGERWRAELVAGDETPVYLKFVRRVGP